MDLNDYQRVASLTALKSALHDDYLLPGLVGEVGELCSLFAKHKRDGHGWAMDLFVKELGDVLWFVAILAEKYHIDLEDVAKINLAKLESRQTRGVIGGSGDDR